MGDSYQPKPPSDLSDKIHEIASMYKTGRYDEALDHVSQLSESEKRNTHVQNLKGLIFIALDRTADARKIFQKLIDARQMMSEAYANMGLLERKKGDLSAAKSFYQTAIDLKPNVGHLYFNLANVQLDCSDYENAIINYKEALSRNPVFVEGFHNLGVAQNMGGDPTAAEKSFLKAILIQENYRPSLEELAKYYRDIGDIKSSLDTYKKIAKFFPNYSEARVRWLGIAIQTMQLEDINFFKEYELTAILKKHLDLHPRYQIYMAIYSLICRNYQELRYHLACYSTLSEGGIVQKNAQIDFRFCNAFVNILKNHLKNEAPKHPHKQLFHFGESHCLTISNQVINVEGEKRQVQSRITFGAKAHHFAQAGPNRFKTITSISLTKIPPKSRVLLSFGEIDCRAKEGFIPAASKLGVPLEVLISRTIHGYVAWFEETNKSCEHVFYFVGVPAPMYKENLSGAVNLSLSNVVKEFNSQLKNHVEKRGLRFVDLHEATSNASGFSNQTLNVDATHLGIAAKTVFEAQM